MAVALGHPWIHIHRAIGPADHYTGAQATAEGRRGARPMASPPCRWVATPAHIISPACVYGCSVDQQGKRGPFYKGAGRELMAQLTLTSPAAKAEALLVSWAAVVAHCLML